MKRYLYISAIALTLVSCGGSHSDEPTPIVPEQPVTPEVPVAAERPMVFAPYESTVSRAGTPMENTYTLFNIWTYKHTQSSTTETVMPGYNVKYLDDSFLWQYDGTTYTSHTEIANQYLKFWDASALSYDFVAYAPVDLPEGLNLVVSNDGFSITGLNAHNATTPDIVVANQQRIFDNLKDVDVIVGKDLDVQPNVYYDHVPLRFHHLLSKVEYRIYNTGTKTAVINNVMVNYDTGESIKTAGDYTEDGWDNFNSFSNTLMSMVYITPNLLELPPITQDNYKTHSYWLATYYEIPQQLNRNLHVSVDVEGEVVSKTFDLGDTSWNYDTNYVYYIHIAAGDSDSSPILIDLTVEDFIADDPINEEQTNW